MIRIRRLPKPTLRRTRYEVQYEPVSPDTCGWHKITPHPVFDLEQVVGTGDAWALIHAADAAWDGSKGDWIALPATDEIQ